MIKKPTRLAYILGYELSELKLIVKNIDKFYYKYSVEQVKNGKVKKRTIYPSIEPLKTIQQRIKCKILDKMYYPEYITGGIKGKDNIKNAKFHLGNKYKFITDIKSFFPSIRPSMVYHMFLNYGFSPDVSKLLTELTTYKDQLPQGTPTSPHIANLVFMEIDEKINNICLMHGITYTRYVDDITLSSKEDLKDITYKVLSIIKCNCFQISHRKTYYKVGPTEITGIITGNNKLDIKNDQKKRLENPDIDISIKKGLKNYHDRVKNSNLIPRKKYIGTIS